MNIATLFFVGGFGKQKNNQNKNLQRNFPWANQKQHADDIPAHSRT